MTKTDAWIARQWASKALENGLLGEVPKVGHLAAARHILATTTPPTMANVEWDAEVHAGLCAEHPKYGLVRMLYRYGSRIDCIRVDGLGFIAPADRLTPIPGTRVDLTPRRESVPESTPAHPEVLTTKEDYENAPEGTIVEEDFCHPWVKDDRGIWLGRTAGEGETCLAMPIYARRVLRWGWGA